MDEATKTCPICREAKPVSAFARNNQRSDGRGSYCSPCRKAKYGDPAVARNRAVPPVMDGEQACRACGITKRVTAFNWCSDKGRRAYKCIECRSAADKARHAADPTRRRAYVIKRKFGLTLEQFDDMLAAQQGGCAICGTRDNPDAPTLAVDHCHASGRVRGLLCGPCNKAIGLLRDDTDLLLKAVTYLESR